MPKFFVDRLKERSTYAALATLLGIAGVSVAPGVFDAGVEVGVAVAGLVGVALLPEAKPAA